MEFRKATRKDVKAIVEMIADDELGQKRENFKDPLPKEYLQAFGLINQDTNQELTVVENENGEVVGAFQLTFIQYLTYQGSIRAQIEAVRVRKDHRGKGLGKLMFEWAIERAKQKGAHLLQLTTDKQRPSAIQFYETLGFKKTHEGMKLHFKFDKA
jgi:GNAT superfamily N-acetyltransferase